MTQADWKSDPNAIHWSPEYGPWICGGCWGALWQRQSDGTITPCAWCAGVEKQRESRLLQTCWQRSGFKPTAGHSFADFVLHAEARPVFDAARQFASEPRGWLTITGMFGTGKSHLAEAITRELLERRVGCLYQRSMDLFAWLGAVERLPGEDTDYAGRLAFAREVPVLVVDEVNRERDTDTVRKLRLQLLDARYTLAVAGQGGATMLISNDPIASWHDAAIASRAADRRFVQVVTGSTDYRRIAR